MTAPATGCLMVVCSRPVLYAQLRRRGDPGCTGKPFIEHRNVPTLDVNPASRRPAWQQADVLRDAIMCALLREHLDAIRAELGVLGLKLPEDA